MSKESSAYPAASVCTIVTSGFIGRKFCRTLPTPLPTFVKLVPSTPRFLATARVTLHPTGPSQANSLQSLFSALSISSSSHRWSLMLAPRDKKFPVLASTMAAFTVCSRISTPIAVAWTSFTSRSAQCPPSLPAFRSALAGRVGAGFEGEAEAGDRGEAETPSPSSIEAER